MDGTFNPVASPNWLQSQQSTHEQLQLEHMIKRSLGVTALSMAKDPMVSGNIGLKNEMRIEMSGAPSTQITKTGETVGQYRNRTQQQGKRSSKTRCSRTSRNNLVDLCESDETHVEEEKVEKENKMKMKKRIMMKLLEMYKNEKEENEKIKIKKAMRSLDDKHSSNKNGMIDFIFEVHTTSLGSFDSADAASNILVFANDDDE